MTDTDNRLSDAFKQYRRSQIAELRPYVVGEELAQVSIAKVDFESGSPKLGDMIARNPKNHDDQWLVAAKYFSDNFEPVERLTTSQGKVERALEAFLAHIEHEDRAGTRPKFSEKEQLWMREAMQIALTESSGQGTDGAEEQS